MSNVVHFDPFAFARQGEPALTSAAEHLARGEALAAEYDTPLPEGDAGLAEALRRLRELRPRARAFRRHPVITIENEEEITAPVTEAEIELEDFIEDTAPETLAGAIVKLRYLTAETTGRALLNGAEETLGQILDLLEREALQ
jgi:hypothetical protein